MWKTQSSSVFGDRVRAGRTVTAMIETPRLASLSSLDVPGRDAGELVLLGFPDVNGVLRGKALRPAAFEAAVSRGLAMTDLILALDPRDTPITDYADIGIRSGAADLLLHPDVSTLREIAWRPGWRLCLATPRWRDGSPCDLASREVLRSVLDRMSSIGNDVLSAVEYEIRVTSIEGAPASRGTSYSLGDIGRYEQFVASLVPALEALGVGVAAVHTEAAPGLLELNLTASRGIAGADDAALSRFAVKEVATRLGLRANFMAKPAEGEEGSSGHVHVSCWSDGRNAFAHEGANDAALAEPLCSAIAGVLEHLAGASLLLNPTINSYKRLVPGWFAPINRSWGIENRSTAVRVIQSTMPDLCRIECRRPGADANPYLALAALVASMHDGISRASAPPPPVVGDAYADQTLPRLPESLESAIAAFEDDSVLRACLGERFSDYYVSSRRWELKAWQQAVTTWEQERYGQTI